LTIRRRATLPKLDDDALRQEIRRVFIASPHRSRTIEEKVFGHPKHLPL
jgi:hypothetical protein